MDAKGSLQAQIQRTLGDAFTLERELGGGGMSRVFVVLDQQLGRRIVVKTLADDVGASVSTDRFRREIRVAASLQQANIVPVHSAGDIDGLPYYTMPFVEGESLRARLDARGALDTRESVNILRDVARALAYAHERGVVHRDIKPENILLSGSTAVVTDFGIAKAIEASQSQTGQATLTQLGTLLGTPMYIAPEQAAGDPNVDHLADIYSLGVVAYEMLAGERPFVGTTVRALLAAHISEAPSPLSRRREGIPARLAALVMRCLEKEPEKRPQRATDLLDALDAVMSAGVATSATSIPSIAVLPFANLSPDPADGFFADGLTDEVITDLSGIRSLRVIARSAMMRYKGTEKDPTAVARELRVRYVLDGSLRRAGTSLRLTARLTDTDVDETLWSDKLSGNVEDVFAMQERLSRTIVDALRITLSPREERRLAARPIEDLKAYEAYLQARQAMWVFAPESLARAHKLLDTARSRIGDDPRLIAALGFLHLNYIESAKADPAVHLAAITDYAERLATIEPESPSRFALLGALEWRRGHIRESIAALTRALELEPNNADVAIYLCYALLLAGQNEKAREVAELAISIDPLTPLFQCMPGFCEIMAGRADAAVPHYRGFLEADPHNPIALFFYLIALAEAEDIPRATEVADRLARQSADTVFGSIARLYASVMRGEMRAGDVVVTAEMRAHAANSDAFARPLGILLAQMGVVEDAIDAIEASTRLGLAHYPYLARNSRVLIALRHHPRFRRLLDLTRERWERGGTSASDLAEGDKPVARAARVTIAVLPFANLSANADDEYFADGMTEDIIAQLSQVGGLRVIARTSAMHYKGAKKRARDIAAELGATHVVEGSARRAGQRLRIVTQLTDAATETQLWSETFDRDMTDVFAVQSEVATRIAGALERRLTPAEKDRVGKRPTADLEAYHLYLLGRHHYNKGTAEAFVLAADCFTRAIARDPSFARAYVGQALIEMYHGGGYWGVRPIEAYGRAADLARRALALDPDVGEAHTVLACCEDWIRYDWSAAEAHFRRAIELTPSHAFTRVMHAWHLAVVGRLDDAIAAAQQAVELDPVAFLIRGNALFFHYLARDHSRFQTELRAAESLVSLSASGAIIRAFEAIARDAAHDVLSDVRQLATEYPNSFNRVLHAWCAAAAGRDDEALSILRDLHALETTEYVWGTGLALTYAHLGDADRAFRYLEQAYEDRAGWMNLVGCCPAFDLFRSDPRFTAILKRVAPVVPLETMRAPEKRITPRRAASSSLAAKALPERRSVAVLPFANLSPDAENAFFADGITDDLIAQVAKIGGLRVIARTSIMRFRSANVSAQQAASELGVSAVVEGTVRRAGKRARIVAQLIDAATDASIWSETYDRDLDDVFSVQTDVATSIAAALQTTLTPGERQRLVGRARIDAETYDTYLRGRHHWSRRTDESIRKAIEYFERCIARAPEFAAAHGGLADAYIFAALGYATMDAADAFARARRAAERALAVDPTSPEALCALALCAMHNDWRSDIAQELLERAIALNANHAPAHQWLAWALFSQGDYVGAVRVQRHALTLDPLSVTLVTESGWPFGYAGLHDLALERYRRALELDPSFALAHYNAGASCHSMGRYDEAFASYDRAIAGLGRVGFILAWVAMACVETGRRDEAVRILEELDQQSQTDPRAWISIALVADALGDTSRALDALEAAFVACAPFVGGIALEGWLPLRSTRSTPEFARLLERIGVKPHDVRRQRELILADAATTPV